MVMKMRVDMENMAKLNDNTKIIEAKEKFQAKFNTNMMLLKTMVPTHIYNIIDNLSYQSDKYDLMMYMLENIEVKNGD